MKRLIISALLVGQLAGVSVAAAAPGGVVSDSSAPVAFNFSNVSLLVFAQATYKNLLGRDFVISPELIASDKRITISVKAVESSKLAPFVDTLLLTHGITSRLSDGVYYLDSAKTDLVVASGAALGAVPGAVLRAAPGALPGAVTLVPGALPGAFLGGVPGALPVGVPAVPLVPDNVSVYRPLNRSVEFMASVVNAAFGLPFARPAGALLVLSSPEKRVAEVLSIVEALDLAPRNVEVSASFVEVSASSSSSRGLSLVASVLSARLGLSVLPSSGVASVSSGGYQVVLDALAADGRFKQVSNSRIVGDESEKMSLIVGDETPTISSTGKDQQGGLIQTIVYRPSGVILDVLPKVLGSGALSLLVDGQVSAFQTTVNGVAGSPTLVKRQVKTSVSLLDGQVLLIGGLDDSKLASNDSGFSFLPSSWRNKTGSNLKTDLVLILSAKVLKN